jgi:hypothetical protein
LEQRGDKKNRSINLKGVSGRQQPACKKIRSPFSQKLSGGLIKFKLGEERRQFLVMSWQRAVLFSKIYLEWGDY